MMNTWNSIIFMKTEKSSDDMNQMSKWDGVENMWSTSGDWDWCIKLDMNSSTPEKTEAFVNKMRTGQWATQTKTQWWKEV